MITQVWRWLTGWTFHRHDYDMDFEGLNFDMIFKCTCGDTTRNMSTAMERQNKLVIIRRR